MGRVEAGDNLAPGEGPVDHADSPGEVEGGDEVRAGLEALPGLEIEVAQAGEGGRQGFGDVGGLVRVAGPLAQGAQADEHREEGVSQAALAPIGDNIVGALAAAVDVAVVEIVVVQGRGDAVGGEAGAQVAEAGEEGAQAGELAGGQAVRPINAHSRFVVEQVLEEGGEAVQPAVKGDVRSQLVQVRGVDLEPGEERHQRFHPDQVSGRLEERPQRGTAVGCEHPAALVGRRPGRGRCRPAAGGRGPGSAPVRGPGGGSRP